MSNIQPYIILNDIDSRTISGLLISSLPPISKPLQRTQVETVDGRDGDLVTPLGFSAYDKVITIGLTYGYNIDDVIEYFNSEGVVVFSNEPDKFYRYAIYEQIDFEKLIRFKKAEVTLHCQPFKFSTTEDTKLFNVVSGQAITVKNNGNIYSRPDITVIGSGEVDLSLNGSQILSLELSDNQAVIIDAEDMNAYAAQSAIQEVVAEVDPIQDLNGYSSVWIGGAGKNLLDYLTNLRSLSSGLTITATADGAIHYQGTASQGYCQLTYTFPLSIASGTTITVSRDKSVAYQHYFSLTYIDDSIEYLRILANTTSATITLSKELKSIDIVCLGLTVNSSYNETIKFQLEKGSSATDWTPYENICDISGSYACNINLCGVNVWNEKTESGAWSNSGTKAAWSGAIRSVDKFPIKPSTNYYFKFSGSIGLYICWFDILGNFIERILITASGVQTTPSNAYFCAFCTHNDYGSTYNDNISINYPASNTDYNKYLGSKYQSFFEGLTKGTYGFVDLGSLTWSYITSGAVPRFQAELTPTGSGCADNTKIANIICSGFDVASWSNVTNLSAYNKNIAEVSGGGYLAVQDSSYTDAESFTEAVSGKYLIYELASATTPTITQEEINTLLQAFGDSLIVVVFGQTVYGARLNVTTGELTITHKHIKMADYKNSFVRRGTSTTGVYRWAFIVSPNIKLSGNEINVISNVLKGVTAYGTYTESIRENYSISGDTTNSYINFFAEDIQTTEDWQQFATDNDVDIVYELADPIVVQLTPAQVNNLLGVNTLYADTGDITVSHKSNGVIVTNTGAIVSFTVAVDDMEKGALLNRLVTGDYDKIRLKKGDNTIVLTGNAQQFVIDKYSRWI